MYHLPQNGQIEFQATYQKSRSGKDIQMWAVRRNVQNCVWCQDAYANAYGEEGLLLWRVPEAVRYVVEFGESYENSYGWKKVSFGTIDEG